MPYKQVYIIGAGPGSREVLTGEARDALLLAECLMGAERLIGPLNGANVREKKAVTAENAVIDAIKNSAYTIYAVLVSGDSGFFSLAKRLLPLLRAEGWDVRALCGVSSVSYFAARLGVPYDGAAIVSLHGRLSSGSGQLERERLLNRLAGLACHNERTFCLTDDRVPPEAICRALVERDLGALRISVGENLSYPDENITICAVKDAPGRKFDGPNIVCLENGAARRMAPPALCDSDFIRGDVPMTKEEVCAVSLSKLRLTPESVCWDVGAGTGAVSCRIALAVPYGRVYAVEKEADGVSLVRQNKQKFGCYNLEVVEGTAPGALSALPPPDAVFIGGSGGSLQAVIREIHGKNPRARVVINAITLETLSDVQTLIAENAFSGVKSPEIVQICVNAVQKAGRCNMFLARNPVFVISFGGGA
jgi:precorrin-6Y C5,15-methyltransferase (decarboxylating)